MMRIVVSTALVLVCTLTATPVNPDLLQRLDNAAARFKAMRATVNYVTHTQVIDENTTEVGHVVMKKVGPGEVQGLINFSAPNERSVTFEKRNVKIYYPKIKTLQIYDLAKHGEELDKFLMIGFGTSGTELAKDYTMSESEPETIDGTRAIHLELVPKAGEAAQYVKKLELWIPQQGPAYPLREKITEPSGDWRNMNYSGLEMNPPLPADALKLKLPPGVKTEHPGK